MKNNKTDKFFQAKLDRFESTPSSEAWQAIGQSLHKRRSLQRRKMLAMAASLILLAGLGFYFITGNRANVLKVADGNNPMKKANHEIAANNPTPLNLNGDFAEQANAHPKPETRNPKLNTINSSKKAMKPEHVQAKAQQSPATTKMPALSNIPEKARNVQPLAKPMYLPKETPKRPSQA